ncbi:ATP-grasp domain-containing protein [Methanotorris igneus]|uniref:Alpha-L-glutamate ligase, RimK family n=1 Tax=Methanotorris igneus (strain DSM 5666 / JCM 11834 / Kol 5) TaxID=880724 RepID=F6BCH2_METIK|nr:alpha-L-glutamate ligase, RimK family [Methanotorris igneus Kol 5]
MIGLLAHKKTLENELILEAFKKRNLKVDFVDSREIINGIENYHYDLILSRVERDYLFEGIYALKFFESEGLNVINNSETVYTCQNKYLTYLKLKKYMPKSFLTYTNNFEKILNAMEKNKMDFPIVIKPIYGGYGNGVVKVNSREELKNIVELLKFHNREIFIQEFVKYENDVRAFVVGDDIIGVMERIPKNDWRANFSLGADVREFKLDNETEELILKCVEKVGADIVGVDVLVCRDKSYILEMNITPQFRGMMKFVDVPNAIVDFCISRIKK